MKTIGVAEGRGVSASGLTGAATGGTQTERRATMRSLPSQSNGGKNVHDSRPVATSRCVELVLSQTTSVALLVLMAESGGATRKKARYRPSGDHLGVIA